MTTTYLYRGKPVLKTTSGPLTWRQRLVFKWPRRLFSGFGPQLFAWLSVLLGGVILTATTVSFSYGYATPSQLMISGIAIAVLVVVACVGTLNIITRRELNRMKRNKYFRFESQQDRTPSFKVLNLYLTHMTPSKDDWLCIDEWLAENWLDDGATFVQLYIGGAVGGFDRNFWEALKGRVQTFQALRIPLTTDFERDCDDLIEEYRLKLEDRIREAWETSKEVAANEKAYSERLLLELVKVRVA